MALTVYLNGKFLAQRTTGVQRVARELVRALDLQPCGLKWVLLRPPAGTAMPLVNIEQQVLGPVGMPLHAWEQACLPWAARAGLLLSLAGSAPWLAARQVVTMHDAAVFDRPDAYRRTFVWWYRALFRWLAQRACHVLTVSDFSAARLAAVTGISPQRLSVVSGGADHLDPVPLAEPWWQSLGLQSQGFLLAVGSLNATKNLAGLLAAYASQSQRIGMPLVIAGGRDGSVFTPVEGWAPTRGLRHLGWVDDSQLKTLYSHAAGLIFPSTYEGFGLPPLEAMRCGCPVAAARIPAVVATCVDAAIYFDPANPEEISQALLRIASDAALRERLRATGFRQAARLPWLASARQLVAALDPCL